MRITKLNTNAQSENSNLQGDVGASRDSTNSSNLDQGLSPETRVHEALSGQSIDDHFEVFREQHDKIMPSTMNAYTGIGPVQSNDNLVNAIVEEADGCETEVGYACEAQSAKKDAQAFWSRLSVEHPDMAKRGRDVVEAILIELGCDQSALELDQMLDEPKRIYDLLNSDPSNAATRALDTFLKEFKFSNAPSRFVLRGETRMESFSSFLSSQGLGVVDPAEGTADFWLSALQMTMSDPSVIRLGDLACFEDFEVEIDTRARQIPEEEICDFIETIGLGNEALSTELAGSWLSSLDFACERFGVDKNFIIALGIHESGGDHWDIDARSPTGARGVFQFTSAAAKDYGLKKSGGKDERLNPKKAAFAASRFIANASLDFNDVADSETRCRLALIAYNCGPGVARDVYAQFQRVHGRHAPVRDAKSLRPLIEKAWTKHRMRQGDAWIDAQHDARAKAGEAVNHNRKIMKIYQSIS